MFVNIFRRLFRQKDIGRENTGKRGEDEARKYVKQMSYKVLETNWKTKIGELDIVAMKDGILVIIEVKASAKLGAVSPEMRVNAKKQHKLKQLAQLYAKSRKLDCPIRFDVIAVWWDHEVRINHIENAFN